MSTLRFDVLIDVRPSSIGPDCGSARDTWDLDLDRTSGRQFVPYVQDPPRR